jgi:hypothetical protein
MKTSYSKALATLSFFTLVELAAVSPARADAGVGAPPCRTVFLVERDTGEIAGLDRWVNDALAGRLQIVSREEEADFVLELTTRAWAETSHSATKEVELKRPRSTPFLEAKVTLKSRYDDESPYHVESLRMPGAEGPAFIQRETGKLVDAALADLGAGVLIGSEPQEATIALAGKLGNHTALRGGMKKTPRIIGCLREGAVVEGNLVRPGYKATPFTLRAAKLPFDAPTVLDPVVSGTSSSAATSSSSSSSSSTGPDCFVDLLDLQPSGWPWGWLAAVAALVAGAAVGITVKLRKAAHGGENPLPSPPLPPFASPRDRWLPHLDLLAIHAAGVEVGLPKRRKGCLVGMNKAYVQDLTVGDSLSDQQLLDLDAFNMEPPLTDGSVPLHVWLTNASSIAKRKREARLFEHARDHVGARMVADPLGAPLTESQVP